MVTCGTGSKGAGPRTANAGGDTVWEYASYYDTGTPHVEVPSTATKPDLSSCKTTTCALNAMGAEGWELVTSESPDFHFKRPK